MLLYCLPTSFFNLVYFSPCCYYLIMSMFHERKHLLMYLFITCNPTFYGGLGMLPICLSKGWKPWGNEELFLFDLIYLCCIWGHIGKYTQLSVIIFAGNVVFTLLMSGKLLSWIGNTSLPLLRLHFGEDSRRCIPLVIINSLLDSHLLDPKESSLTRYVIGLLSNSIGPYILFFYLVLTNTSTK